MPKSVKTTNATNNFENTCFVIMPISQPKSGYEDDPGHFDMVYSQIFIPAIKKSGYEPYRVDEDNLSQPIIDKIFSAVSSAPMALCDLSSRNPNVLYELGLRHAYDKPVVLVKDNKTDNIFDVSGINTIKYDSHRLVENVNTAIENIAKALIEAKNDTYNSITKIIKASSAVYSNDNIDPQESTSIMLKSILSEIDNLKNNINSITTPLSPKTTPEYHSMFYEIEKSKIDREEINWIVRSTPKHADCSIDFIEEDDRFIFIVTGTNDPPIRRTLRNLKSRIDELSSNNQREYLLKK